MTGSLDALLVPGTGILDDFGGEKPTGWPLTLALWFGMARMRGVRTGLVSIGAGPLAHPVSRRLARAVGVLADYRSFRDTGSRDFMISTGLDVPADEIAPDIVFSLPWSGSTEPRTGRPLVAIPVMKYHGWYAQQRTASIANRHTSALGTFCGWLLDQGYAVRLVSADVGDQPATEDVATSVTSTNPELARRWLTTAVAGDLDDLNRLLSDASVVVATRYHSVISALICGKPTISLGYAAKNDQLMAAVGLGAYCQHVERIDQDLLRRQFEDLMANQRRLEQEIGARVAEFQARLAAEEERLTACLGNAVTSRGPGQAARMA
jgi:polysaccharide pyruvyl transferase WcaK-like protein